MLFKVVVRGSNDSRELAECKDHGHVIVRVAGITDEAAAQVMVKRLINLPTTCCESLKKESVRIDNVDGEGDDKNIVVEVVSGSGELLAANPLGEKFFYPIGPQASEARPA